MKKEERSKQGLTNILSLHIGMCTCTSLSTVNDNGRGGGGGEVSECE